MNLLSRLDIVKSQDPASSMFWVSREHQIKIEGFYMGLNYKVAKMKRPMTNFFPSGQRKPDPIFIDLL